MKLFYIAWIPAILIMGVIYYFSSKPAVVSAESSMTIANGIIELYENITDAPLQEATRPEKVEKLDHIVRKCAHFLEYMVLAAALCLPLWIKGMEGKRRILLAVVLTAVYAVSDEFHQTFVPGRSGELKDVLIDTSGAVLGAFLFFFATATKRSRIR